MLRPAAPAVEPVETIGAAGPETSVRMRTVKIVVVCTGNICRSPAMQLLLDEALDDSVEVTSAGTQGMPAWPISEPMARLLLANDSTGAHPSSSCGPQGTQDLGRTATESGDQSGLAQGVADFRSQRLTEQMVRDADLILTATADHRGEVLNLSPLALRRTMSLGELARLAQVVDKSQWANATNDADRLKKLVPLALAARHAPADASADDIVDPYGRSEQTYARSYGQITHHINALVKALHQ